MLRWAKPELPRDQILLIPLTLGDRIPEDHQVRLLAEILDSLDWSSWERHYVLVAGQPPIHPKIIAGALIYGLSMGIRSSRRLEWLCDHAVDFLWLVEDRHIDHSTFCKFRTQFARELKDLFRQVNQVAIRMGLLRLNQVSYDGTTVKANSSRHATATAKTLEQRLAEVDAQIEAMFAQMDQKDREETDLFGDVHAVSTLPQALGNIKKRQAALQKALQAARAAEKKKAAAQKATAATESSKPESPAKEGADTAPASAASPKKDCPSPPKKKGRKKSAGTPVADPDSVILPNKEGGYAPNYTPVTLVDDHRGFIVDTQVLSAQSEPAALIPMIDRLEAEMGIQPQALLADGALGTGANLAALEQRRITAFIPVESQKVSPDNPALRPDPTQPVPAEQWDKLPRRDQTHKLDRSSFVYDERRDCYYCPMGRELTYNRTRSKARKAGEHSEYRVYRCADCSGCPLREVCLSGRAGVRTVEHDQHHAVRQRMAVRMRSESGRRAYARRAPLSETPHGIIKGVQGLRQFLLRGLDKVNTEWLWHAAVHNIRKLINEIVRIRGAVRAAMAAPGG